MPKPRKTLSCKRCAHLHQLCNKEFPCERCVRLKLDCHPQEPSRVGRPPGKKDPLSPPDFACDPDPSPFRPLVERFTRDFERFIREVQSVKTTASSRQEQTNRPAEGVDIDGLERFENLEDVANGLLQFSQSPSLVRTFDDDRLRRIFGGWRAVVGKLIDGEPEIEPETLGERSNQEMVMEATEGPRAAAPGAPEELPREKHSAAGYGQWERSSNDLRGNVRHPNPPSLLTNACPPPVTVPVSGDRSNDPPIPTTISPAMPGATPTALHHPGSGSQLHPILMGSAATTGPLQQTKRKSDALDVAMLAPTLSGNPSDPRAAVNQSSFGQTAMSQRHGAENQTLYQSIQQHPLFGGRSIGLTSSQDHTAVLSSSLPSPGWIPTSHPYSIESLGSYTSPGLSLAADGQPQRSIWHIATMLRIDMFETMFPGVGLISDLAKSNKVCFHKNRDCSPIARHYTYDSGESRLEICLGQVDEGSSLRVADQMREIFRDVHGVSVAVEQVRQMQILMPPHTNLSAEIASIFCY